MSEDRNPHLECPKDLSRLQKICSSIDIGQFNQNIDQACHYYFNVLKQLTIKVIAAKVELQTEKSKFNGSKPSDTNGSLNPYSLREPRPEDRDGRKDKKSLGSPSPPCNQANHQSREENYPDLQNCTKKINQSDKSSLQSPPVHKLSGSDRKPHHSEPRGSDLHIQSEQQQQPPFSQQELIQQILRKDQLMPQHDYPCRVRGCSKIYQSKENLALHQMLKHRNPPTNLATHKFFRVRISLDQQ